MSEKPDLNSKKTATLKSWARLTPTEELAKFKQRLNLGSHGYGPSMAPTLEVTPALVEVLRLGLNELVSQRDRSVEDAGRQGSRAVRAELCTQIYLRFVENLSDDTVEGMTVQDIGDAARDLLAEMY